MNGPIAIRDEGSVALTRSAARAAAVAAGFDTAGCERMALIVSELGHNQLRYAFDGAIEVRGIVRDGVQGVEVVASDRGPGIADPAGALAGGASEVGLGAGFGAVRRLARELDIDVRIGQGTTIRARCFAGPVGRVAEVGIFGRPKAGEQVSGDDAALLRSETGWRVAVIDGIGHGEPAREAAARAVASVQASAGASLEETLRHLDLALRGTRGAVVGLVELPAPLGEIAAAVIGNVAVHVFGGRSTWRAAGVRGSVGSPAGAPRVRIEKTAAPPLGVVVMYTDGVPSSTDVRQVVADHLHAHPIEIAAALVRTAPDVRDDALVLVSR